MHKHVPLSYHCTLVSAGHHKSFSFPHIHPGASQTFPYWLLAGYGYPLAGTDNNEMKCKVSIGNFYHYLDTDYLFRWTEEVTNLQCYIFNKLYRMSK